MNKTPRAILFLLIILLIICFVMNISLGSVSIPLSSIWDILIDNETVKETWRITILQIRIPKAITAILVGTGLSVSGLLMQTLFRNPLAGPFVIGLSSGANLGVALLIMGSTLFGEWFGSLILNHYSITTAASIGSFLVLSVVIMVARNIKDGMSILIIGLMFGSISSAIVNILSYFSTANHLQKFTLWSLGSLGNISFSQLIIFTATTFIGWILSIFCIKPLNALLLGENYARSMGVNVKKSRYLIIISTSLLAGSCTAFVGPIAFIGLAVPHITRLFFNTSNHKTLLIYVSILGSILMLICDTIAQVPFSDITLPINAITSIIGAPVVIWLLIRKRKVAF